MLERRSNFLNLKICLGSASSKYFPWNLVMMGAVCIALLLLLPGIAFSDEGVSGTKSLEMRGVAFSKLHYKVTELAGVGVAGSSVRLVILEELREGGINVLDSESETFGGDSSQDAEFVLAGTVRELKCEGGFEQSCRILITWEVFDRTIDQVVYEVATRATQKEITYKNTEEKLIALVKTSLYSLMERKQFIDVLKREDKKTSNGDEVPSSESPQEPTAIKHVDRPDVLVGLPKEELKDKPQTPKYQKALGGGIVTTLVGTVLVIGSYGATKSMEKDHTLTYDKLDSMTALNTVGFIVAGVGVGLIATGVIFQMIWKKKQKDTELSHARLKMGLSLNAALVEVSF